MKLLFVSDFYDKPLRGLCEYRGKLYKYTAEYEEDGYNLYQLTFFEKCNWVFHWKLFELCVGSHFSYDFKSENFFKFKKPVWLHKKLYNLYYSKFNKWWPI